MHCHFKFWTTLRTQLLLQDFLPCFLTRQNKSQKGMLNVSFSLWKVIWYSFGVWKKTMKNKRKPEECFLCCEVKTLSGGVTRNPKKISIVNFLCVFFRINVHCHVQWQRLHYAKLSCGIHFNRFLFTNEEDRTSVQKWRSRGKPAIKPTGRTINTLKWKRHKNPNSFDF